MEGNVQALWILDVCGGGGAGRGNNEQRSKVVFDVFQKGQGRDNHSK